MNKRVLYTVGGFALAGAGLYALIVSLVGLNVTYLNWLAPQGRFAVFMAQLVMIMLGAVLIVLGATDWEKERRLIERFERERRLSGVDAREN